LEQNPVPGQLVLSWDGWQAAEPGAGGAPGLSFVAMAFCDELKAAYDDGILPAVENDCGLKAVRADREHFTEKICDRIIVDIRRAASVKLGVQARLHWRHYRRYALPVDATPIAA
jgi:hypothetical protein